jgi:alkylhydroperoxidase family enzyme
MRDFRDADLDEADVAIMAFAEKVALHAYRVTLENIETLRGHGLTDAEVFDIALAAALRCFFSKVLDSMGAEPDEAYAEAATLLELVPLAEPAAASSAGTS